jgi:hypothetical protein
MQTLILQDWITINGTNATPFIQTEPDWLDMSAFQDVFAWIDVREASPGASPPTIFLETAPARDDVLFMSMNGSAGYALAASATPLIAQLAMGIATVPIARLLRWKVIGPGASSWDATFRILVAGNSPGLTQAGAASCGCR